MDHRMCDRSTKSLRLVSVQSHCTIAWLSIRVTTQLAAPAGRAAKSDARCAAAYRTETFSKRNILRRHHQLAATLAASNFGKILQIVMGGLHHLKAWL